MVTVLLALQQRGGTRCWCHLGQEGLGSCSMMSAQEWGPSSTWCTGSCAMAGGIVAGVASIPPWQLCPPWAPQLCAPGGCYISAPGLGSVPISRGRAIMETQ